MFGTSWYNMRKKITLLMAQQRKKKILIAEDEKPLARALQLKLQHVGYDVVTASNGVEALQALQEQKFDLAVLDLMMPEKD
jgi:CheY-like chemotaxis protein